MMGGSSMVDASFRTGEWMALNEALMDILDCAFSSSPTVQATYRTLVRETLKGGVSILAANTTSPGAINGKSDAPPAAAAAAASGGGSYQVPDVRKAMERGIRYACLYGLVPLMANQHKPGAIHVPPVNSGRFMARMIRHGHIEVGWQWRDEGMGGSTTDHPDPKVFVYVWGDRYPLVESSAPFTSMIQPLLTEMHREAELVEADTQANYELSHPPFVLQEQVRGNRNGPLDRGVMEVHVRDYVADIRGERPGHGPGGTITGQQRSMLRADAGGSTREGLSRRRSQRQFQGDSVRIRIDPCTGEVVRQHRTLMWQRGPYTVPTGFVVTNGYGKPTLRGDLLAHRNYLATLISSALGVPQSFVHGGGGAGMGSDGKRRDARSQSSSGRGNSAPQYSQASQTMRTTVSDTRRELSAMVEQAHLRILWPREAFELSSEVALSERALSDSEAKTSKIVERQLELLGGPLRRIYEASERQKKTDTEWFHRLVRIADRATELWANDQVHKRAQVIKDILDGDGVVAPEVLVEEDRRGRGQSVKDLDILRDTRDLDGDPTQLSRRDSHEGGLINPNELAGRSEPPSSITHVTLPLGSDSSVYTRDSQRIPEYHPVRALVEILDQVETTIGDRTKLVKSVNDKRFRLSHPSATATESAAAKGGVSMSTKTSSVGGHGSPKIRVAWNAPPVADWDLLRTLAMDDLIPPRVFQAMVLSDIELGGGLGLSAPASRNLGINLRGTPEPFSRTRPAQAQSQTRNQNQNQTQSQSKPKPKPKPKPRASSPAARDKSGERKRARGSGDSNSKTKSKKDRDRDRSPSRNKRSRR